MMQETQNYPLSEIIKNKLDEYLTQSEKNDYDIIISDTVLENIKYENITGKNISEALNYYTNKYKNILLILEHNSIDNIFNILIKQEKITVLDMYTGIFGLGKKSTLPTIQSYSLRNYGFETYSPIDENNLENIINSTAKKDNKKYIEINEILFPQKLADEDLPITIHYEQGQSNITILTIGYPYIQVGQALQDSSFNGELLISDTITLNKKTCSYIEETRHLVIVIDTTDPESIKKIITAQLYEHKIFDKKISIITPNYEKLGTILAEYQMEEADFDTQAIKKQLQKY